MNVPMGSLPPEPTRLERLAELAGVDPDELRDSLRDAIADADHELMQAVLAEAWAASSSSVFTRSSVERVERLPRSGGRRSTRER